MENTDLTVMSDISIATIVQFKDIETKTWHNILILGVMLSHAGAAWPTVTTINSPGGPQKFWKYRSKKFSIYPPSFSGILEGFLL